MGNWPRKGDQVEDIDENLRLGVVMPRKDSQEEDVDKCSCWVLMVGMVRVFIVLYSSSSLNQLEWFKFNLVKMILNYIVITTK